MFGSNVRLVAIVISCILATTTVKGQAYNWTQLCENLPGAYVLQQLETSSYHVVISGYSLNYRLKNSADWESNPLPKELVFDQFEEMRIEVPDSMKYRFCVTEVEPGKAIFWSISKSGSAKLMYTTNMGKEWESELLNDSLDTEYDIRAASSADGSIWIVESNRSTKKIRAYQKKDMGVTPELKFELKSNYVHTCYAVGVSDSSMAFLTYVNDLKVELYVYKQDSLKHIKSFTKEYKYGITSARNKVYVPSYKDVYEYDAATKKWKIYPLTHNDKMYESQRDLTICSTHEGDVTIVKKQGEYITVAEIMTSSSTAFVQPKALKRVFYNMLSINGKLFFGDESGIWALENDSLKWQSEGLNEAIIGVFAVKQDLSEVVALTYYGTAFYKSLKDGGKWQVCGTDQFADKIYRPHGVFMLNNGVKCVAVDDVLLYSVRRGNSWQQVKLKYPPQTVRISKNKVFVHTLEGLMSTSDGINYSLYSTQSGLSLGNYDVLDDTILVQYYMRNFVIGDSKNYQTFALPTTDYIQKILYHKKYGYGVIARMQYQPKYEKLGVAWTKNGVDWDEFQEIKLARHDVKFIDAAVGPDSAIYITSTIGTHRVDPQSKVLVQIEENIGPRKNGGILVQPNRLFKVKYPGIIEYLDMPTSITEEKIEQEKQKIQVFPQPANTHITIAGLTPGTILRVTDVNGCEVYTATANTDLLDVNTTAFAQGMYVVNAGGKAQQFVVTK